MRPETLLSYVRAVPFRPFRVVMNHGKIYDVMHPEFVRVGRDSWTYYHMRQPDGPYERFDIVSLLLIQNIEYIDVPQGAPSSGDPPA